MNKKQKNRLKNKVFQYTGLFCTFIGLLVLALFILEIIKDGFGRISWQFFTELPSRFPEKAGIYTAWVGSMWIITLTAILSVPVGVGAGIFLEEYGRQNFIAGVLEINITNLAGVPSIIYGLLGLGVFVRSLNFGGSVLAAASTLSLLILPTIIVATREAVKAVPGSIREASYGLGASKWQTIRYQVLPAAAGGIMTGIILALSRAIGETAPLIVIGVLAFVPFAPTNPLDEFSALPVQIFNWISRPQQGFIIDAAAGIIMLLFITFLLNALAVYLRYRWQRQIR